MEGKKISILTIDGKRITGVLTKVDINPIGSPRWFNVKTPSTMFKINADHIVTITHWPDDPEWSESKKEN